MGVLVGEFSMHMSIVCVTTYNLYVRECVLICVCVCVCVYCTNDVIVNYTCHCVSADISTPNVTPLWQCCLSQQLWDCHPGH